MSSDRDTLTNLLLDCEETAASPGETADYLLERGWRPPARVIETAEELDALPDGAIIRSFWGVVGQKEDEAWVFPNMIGRHLGTDFDLPAIVVWQPEVNAE